MSLKNESSNVSEEAAKKELKEILKSIAEVDICRNPFIFCEIDSYTSFVDELINKYQNNEQN